MLLACWLFVCKVVKVDECGKRLSTYTSEGLWPLYSLYDPATHHILVVDTDNHKILLFNNDLSLERVLLSGGGQDRLDKPWRLSYEQRSGRLFVGMPDGRINIYRVRWIKRAAVILTVRFLYDNWYNRPDDGEADKHLPRPCGRYPVLAFFSGWRKHSQKRA